MALETKVLNTAYFTNQQELVDMYSCFGWQTISLTDNRVTMNREVNINNYVELTRLEKEFESHKCAAERAYVKSQIDIKLTIFLILIFIFPGVIYLVVKSKWKKRLLEENKLMHEISDKARALFYGTN